MTICNDGHAGAVWGTAVHTGLMIISAHIHTIMFPPLNETLLGYPLHILLYIVPIVLSPTLLHTPRALQYVLITRYVMCTLHCDFQYSNNCTKSSTIGTMREQVEILKAAKPNRVNEEHIPI